MCISKQIAVVLFAILIFASGGTTQVWNSYTTIIQEDFNPLQTGWFPSSGWNGWEVKTRLHGYKPVPLKVKAISPSNKSVCGSEIGYGPHNVALKRFSHRDKIRVDFDFLPILGVL